MSEHQREPLPDDLRALFEREREQYPENAALKREVLRHVERAVMLAAPVAGAGTLAKPLLKTATSAKKALLAAFAAGALVGGGVVHVVHQQQPTREPEPAAAAPLPVVIPLPVPDTAKTPEDAHVHAPALQAPSAPAKHQPNATRDPANELAREQKELEIARAALLHGQFDDALAAAAQHARHFPHGQLGEEREFLVIQALRMAGLASEAEAHARQFRAHYRRSLFLPAIEAILKPANKPTP